MKKEKWLIAFAAGAGVAAIAYKLLSKNIPDNALAVHPFDINRYLGKWNEVARLPNRIEKHVKYLTEDYSYDEDDMFKVITKGYNTKTNEWKEVTGKMKFAGSENFGMLKVSYFGPFYAAYNILAIDDDYQHALVSSNNLDYLWILSRESHVPDNIKAWFLNTAALAGFDVDALEWV